MKRVLTVLNPTSRSGPKTGRRLRELSADRIETLWISLEELPQSSLEGFDRVLAVGGDGTVNAVASFLIERESHLPLGIVPAGTGNNLCWGLGLPLDPEEAFRVAVGSDRTREIDVFRVETGEGEAPCYIVQTSALGFPSEVSQVYDRLRKWRWFRLLGEPLGPYVYRVLAFFGIAGQRWKEFRGRGALQVRCRFPGEEFEASCIALVVGNERSTGGEFVPCPQAQVDDALMDLCFLEAGRRVSYIALLTRVAKGTHVGSHESVVYRQTPGPLEIELSEPSTLLVDGDFPRTSTRFKFTLLPRRLRVVCGAD